MLEEPRWLLARAAPPLAPPPAPPNALLPPEPEELETCRFPTRSPPPPLRFTPMLLAPPARFALVLLAPPPAGLVEALPPPEPRFIVPDCCLWP
jgi:hypothetical protein